MRYQYSKLQKKGKEFIIIQPFGAIDGDDVRDLTLKHATGNQRIVVLQKDENGKNHFSSINPRNFNDFDDFESFDNLDWKTDFIE